MSESANWIQASLIVIAICTGSAALAHLIDSEQPAENPNDLYRYFYICSRRESLRLLMKAGTTY